jgi:hypothetical protein
MAARLWCAVAVIAVGFCAVQPFLVIRAYRTQERVIVLDPSGTFHVSPLLGFEEATKLHEQHALLACLALFQRNPAGFDYPELLDKLFLADAARKARADAVAQAEEFTAKALHQKPEVQKITVLETRENTVLAQAEGQLGSARGRSTARSSPKPRRSPCASPSRAIPTWPPTAAIPRGMELRYFTLIAFWFFSSAAHAAVRAYPLDERSVYTIRIGRDAPTTCVFPDAPTALEGAGVVNQDR